MSGLGREVRAKLKKLKFGKFSSNFGRKSFLRRLRIGSVALAYTLSIVAIFVYHPQPAEAAISFKGTAVASTGGNTSLAISRPLFTSKGDVMVINLGLEGQNNTAITAPAGWTLILHSNNGTSVTMNTYYKIAGNNENIDCGPSCNYIFSWTGSTRAAMSMSSYKGADNVNPIINVTGTNNSGTGTSLLANGVTTTVANTMLIYAAGASSIAAINFTPPAGMTERAETGSANSLSNDVSITMAEETIATASATGTRTGTSSVVVTWATHMFALRPGTPPPPLDQSSYRFLSNLDAQNPEYILSDPSPIDDSIRGLATDSANGFFYIGGNTSNGTNWVVEKRRLSDGSKDTAFTFPTPPTGVVEGLALDPAGSAIFVVGQSSSAWQIEKRRLSDGALCTAANCGTAFDTDGILIPGISGSPNSVDIDTTNGFIYPAGYDTANGNQTRVGKYSTSTGAASAGFTQTGNGAGATVCASISGTACYNVTNGDDRLRTVQVDVQGGYLYAGGWDSATTNIQWHMQKRRLSDGALCTAANCGTAFDTDGIYQSNPTAGTDQLLTFQVDTPGGAIYAGGFDSTSGNQWRLIKLNVSDASAVTAFGTSGVVTFNTPAPNAATDDQLLDLDLDDAGGYLYTTGQVGGQTTSDHEWRIEKRQRSDGALCTAATCGDPTGIVFGNYGCGVNGGTNTEGALCVNPSTANPDAPAWISVDLPRNLLYTAGGDRSLGANKQQWRIQKFDLDYGNIWLNTPQDTAALASTNISFRLRMLLHVNTQQMLAGVETFKLQYATKVGTCDTSFVNEVYNDVDTTTGEIIYHDNPSITDASAMKGISYTMGTMAQTGTTITGTGTAFTSSMTGGTIVYPSDGTTATVTYVSATSLTSSVSKTVSAGTNYIIYYADPLHSTHSNVYESIEESNSFSPLVDVGPGQDGMWDFVLKDNNAFGVYCFRAVYNDNTRLDQASGSYIQVPEISFCRNTPNTDALLRGGTYFCGGVKKPFYWAKD